MSTTDILPGIQLQVTPRPKDQHKGIMKAAMLELYNQRLKSLLAENGDIIGDQEEEEIIDQLVDNYSDDAYAFARRLDDEGWEMDFNICDALDGAWIKVRNEREKAEKAWYAENPFPLFEVGQKVKVNGKFHPANGKTLFINKVDDKLAKYCVGIELNSSSNYIIDHEELAAE